ncbi:hypothetical protein [Pyrodictium delaneyi]|uniref:hypothetical protein n=1 Tax=Pyrodictium delaneyi TaxID=1273541 RepID=UPI00117A9A18|nr:hypothetical protein [Pyrodictium delaneyi]
MTHGNPINKSKITDNVIKQVNRIDTNWRQIDRIITTMNTIVLGYQVVIGKIFGKNFSGMTQMLLREVGSLLSKLVDSYVNGSDYIKNDLAEAIKRSLLETGIAKKVYVHELPADTRSQRIIRKFKIKIKDSIFRPVYKTLATYGYREFPLSPEGLLVTAIILRHLQEKGNTDTRLTMHALIPQDSEEDLEIIVEQVKTHITGK